MKKFHIIVLSIALAGGICGFTNSLDMMAAPVQVKQKTSTKAVTTTTTKPTNYNYITVNSLDLVKNPNLYLNKRVKIVAKFDKFSTLGLDYKPAMRSSEKYITFLIRRDDAKNDIPLSELKNFMQREKAEKFIDLESDDLIEYSGLVFSNALGDVWLDVEDFKILNSKSKNKNTQTAKSK